MMNDVNLITKITQMYPKLTKAERKVADVVTDNPKKVLDATITDLAELCGVGETSVFRFCRSLGLQGYQDFKVNLALSANTQETPDSSEIIDGYNSSDLDVLVKSIHNSYLIALNDAIASLDRNAVRKAVNYMLNASSIHFFGMGGSGITALEAENKFLKITPHVSFHSDSHAQITTAALLNASCAAVIFSNSGITKDFITLARLAHENGASVILITKFEKTPAAKYADVILTSGAVEGPIQGGSIAGKISQLFMVDVLYTEYSRNLRETALENKRRTAAAIAEKML